MWSKTQESVTQSNARCCREQLPQTELHYEKLNNSGAPVKKNKTKKGKNSTNVRNLRGFLKIEFEQCFYLLKK